MNLRDALEVAVLPGLSLLPDLMDTPNARANLLTIGMQESRFKHRRQIGGPARSFYQFEGGQYSGVAEVLTNKATKTIVQGVLDKLQYTYDRETCFTAIEHNDMLATVFARLLLFTLPCVLPGRNDYDESWRQYIAAWHPGRPHRETWDSFYRDAWAVVAAQ